jgi:hypothetical protein
MVAALLIGVVYTVIVMKLSLTTGLVPTLNVSAALLAFLALRGWTHALGKLGIASRPFTRQENTVVQTCVVACYTIGFGGKALDQINQFLFHPHFRAPPDGAPLSAPESRSINSVINSCLALNRHDCRRVRVLLAGAGQEDVRAVRGEHAGQRAGELQGPRHRLDDRLPARRQFRRPPHLAPPQKGTCDSISRLSVSSSDLSISNYLSAFTS